MKADVMTMDAKAQAKIDLPRQFDEEIREDLIKRAVEAAQANARQAYGASEEAGARHATKLSHRRRDYKTTYGHGISRTPRKILSRRGTRFFWVGAFAPNTVGGRRAHPPKPIKNWSKKINDKERRKAIRSAMSAAMIKDLVVRRGHRAPDTYPFVLDSAAESIDKTKDLRATLTKLGLQAELARSATRRVRAGKGKMRGRRTRTTSGPLLVVSKACKLQEAAKNLPGLEICVVDQLNAQLLAPGASAGRMTIFTKDAIERLASEGLFLPGYKGPQPPKKAPPQKKQGKAQSTTEAKPAKTQTAKAPASAGAKTEQPKQPAKPAKQTKLTA